MPREIEAAANERAVTLTLHNRLSNLLELQLATVMAVVSREILSGLSQPYSDEVIAIKRHVELQSRPIRGHSWCSGPMAEQLS